MEIIIKDVKKYYSERLVLDIHNLLIEKGKITGIIGPNGSGKSTLLNIIAGLDNEHLGQVEYNKSAINKDIYKKMTIVSQKPYLFRRRVYDNIEYPLKIRNIKKDIVESKVKEVIKRFEIEDLENKKAHLLSGGESQKVSLARALIFEPKLLLLDEPTSNIDPQSIKIMEREIIRFNKETNGTVIIVTHNIDQSERLCHDIVYLEEGKVGN